MRMISHNLPSVDEREVKAVTRVLHSRWLVEGQEVEKLEIQMKQLVGARYASAVNSGTSALHLSLLVLGIGQEDEVMLPTYTCTALLNAINYTGATPVLVDLEEEGFNLDPDEVKRKLSDKTKVIIVPHTYGMPARIVQIQKLGVPILEDCAQALGSLYRGKPLGSFGDISIFSFYTTKVIAAGQGGMMVTNNKRYFEFAKDLVHYDRRRDYKVRYNYLLTDVAASIANVQLKKLNFFIKKRKSIASRYIKVLNRKRGIRYFPRETDSTVNHFRFILRFRTKKTRDRVKSNLGKLGISTIVPLASYQLLHRYLGLEKRRFPNAERLGRTTLSLPIYPSLTKAQVERICSALDSLIP